MSCTIEKSVCQERNLAYHLIPTSRFNGKRATLRDLLILAFVVSLGGCMFPHERSECQRFGGQAFDSTSLMISGRNEIFDGGKLATASNCVHVIGPINAAAAIFRSNDKGNTWKGGRLPVAHKFLDSEVASIATAPDGAVYVAITLHVRDQVVPFLYEPINTMTHLYRSMDGGATWEETAVPSATSKVLAIAAGRDSNIFAFVYNEGLQRSKDGGANWSSAGLTMPYSRIRCTPPLLTDRDGYVYACGAGGGEDGYYRSTDNGATWHRLPIRVGPNNNIAANSRGQLVATESGPWEASLFRSNDNGETWEEIEPPIKTWVEKLAIGEGGEIYFEAMEDLFHPLRGGMYRSSDGGMTWASLTHWPWPRGTLAIDRQGVLFVGIAKELVVDAQQYREQSPPGAFGGEVYRSFDHGTTWEVLNVLR